MTDPAASLKRVYESLRGDVRERWHRDLPFDELLVDRWERARSLGFGEKSSIYALSYVYGDVSVGNNVWIGPFTLLDGTGGLTIGDYCSISAGVHIYSHDSVARAVSGGRAPVSLGPVQIGARTYIGSQSIISNGVTIGEGCVIGAGSFVNRDIPPGSFAVGSPCKVIGRVDIGQDGSIQLVTERVRSERDAPPHGSIR